MTAPAQLRRANANVARGSRQLATLIERWLTAYAEEQARIEIAKLSPSVLKERKTAKERELEEQLRALLLRFGVRQAASAAERAAREGGTPMLIPEALVRDAVAGKETRIKWFWEMRDGVIQRVNDLTDATKDEVRASVRRIIEDAQNDAGRHRFQDGRTGYVAPSMGEIARRIHTQFHGKEADGRIRVFSPERAAIIAQTELGQAENLGIFEGYEASGVEEIEWLSRTGSIRHGSLNHKRVAIGEFFVASNGDRLRHPGDMSAPIRSTINCQCTSRAVISRAAKSLRLAPPPGWMLAAA